MIKVGETFTLDGTEYMAELPRLEDDPCEGCVFDGDDDGCSRSPICTEWNGDEGYTVIFVEAKSC